MRQKTLLNLGANFPIPKDQWPELVEIIQAELAGKKFLFEPTPELAEAAKAIVQKLRSRALVMSSTEALDGGTANVQLDSVEIDNARSVGCEHLALASLEALGFLGVLKDVGLSGSGRPDRHGAGDCAYGASVQRTGDLAMAGDQQCHA